MNYADTIIDGPYIEELRDVSLSLRGSSNQRIIEVVRNEDNILLKHNGEILYDIKYD